MPLDTFLVFARDEDDGGSLLLKLLPDLSDHLGARLAGHLDIRDDDVGALVERQAKSFVAVAGDKDVGLGREVPIECPIEHPSDAVVVVD